MFINGFYSECGKVSSMILFYYWFGFYWREKYFISLKYLVSLKNGQTIATTTKFLDVETDDLGKSVRSSLSEYILMIPLDFS